MKIVRLRGGLGNQLFQYAFGKNIQKQTNETVKYDTSWFKTGADYDHDILYLDFFETTYEVANKGDLQNILPFGKIGKELAKRSYNKFPTITQKLFNYISEIDKRNNNIFETKPYLFKYDPSIWRNKKNLYFDGYWQASQYPDSVSETLIHELNLTEPLSEQSRTINNKVTNSESVSIHFRRGDYTKYGNTLSLEYYKNSVEKIRDIISSPQFYIFSDNIDWVKRNFKLGSNFTYVNHNGAKKAYEDLILMSSCKHNIIANSTFSWWGAWLNQNYNKTVIAPDDWLGHGSSGNIDIFPNAWNTLAC